MDLGARHCTARTPRCADCPLASLCTWRTEGGPDPAATSRPSAPAFGGSDRFHRGRLVDALREGPVAGEDLASAARTDDRRRARLLADRLVADGLAEWDGARLRLPA
jgi:A/G-specific adenine glycosylase